jgi:hypothetical protein
MIDARRHVTTPTYPPCAARNLPTPTYPPASRGTHTYLPTRAGGGFPGLTMGYGHMSDLDPIQALTQQPARASDVPRVSHFR